MAAEHGTEPGLDDAAGDELHVAVIDSSALQHQALVAELVAEGCVVHEPETAFTWMPPRNATAAVVIAVGSPEDLDQIRASRERGPAFTIVALLDHHSPSTYRQALRAGASTAVHRDSPLDDILQAMWEALAGRTLLPTNIVQALVRGWRVEDDGSGIDGLALVRGWRGEDDASGIDGLQLALLRGLKTGLTVRELARRVGYSERETHRQLRRLYQQLGVNNRSQAIVEAMRRGLAT